MAYIGTLIGVSKSIPHVPWCVAHGPVPIARVHQTLYSPIKGIHVESVGFWWSASVSSGVAMSTASVESIRDRQTKSIENARLVRVWGFTKCLLVVDSMLLLYLDGCNIFGRLGSEISCVLGCGSQ